MVRLRSKNAPSNDCMYKPPVCLPPSFLWSIPVVQNLHHTMRALYKNCNGRWSHLFVRHTSNSNNIIFDTEISEFRKIKWFAKGNNMTRIIHNKIWQNQMFTKPFNIFSNFRRETFVIGKPRHTIDISKIQDNNWNVICWNIVVFHWIVQNMITAHSTAGKNVASQITQLH